MLECFYTTLKKEEKAKRAVSISISIQYYGQDIKLCLLCCYILLYFLIFILVLQNDCTTTCSKYDTVHKVLKCLL